MIRTRLERSDDRAALRRIAQGHGDVPQPAFVADAPDRGAFGVFQKFFCRGWFLR